MDPQTHRAPADEEERNDIEKNKDIAAFSYLWVMSVPVYFLRKQSPFVRYHSKQAILLFVLSIPIWFIPIMGRLLELVIMAGMAMGFFAAAQGQYKDVPIVGPLSRGEITIRQAWQQLVEAILRIIHAMSGMSKSQKTKTSSASSNPPQEKPHDPPPPSLPPTA
jgi:uncharacterized membrane protein